ncbi:hypothetical protein [Thalassotalea eurytherma]|uniref:Uncharacterized protein n=1 Tax=Thalassotalea eurytherma TaxID=1144278 RepID=A0ABQ6H6V2_9GAMM|nr:hypothetical protein [Thalassotalea eurytherma]GLX82480.1 hypothetical protein theurythT_19320 [Thalassotalea eurytherma]
MASLLNYGLGSLYTNSKFGSGSNQQPSKNISQLMQATGTAIGKLKNDYRLGGSDKASSAHKIYQKQKVSIQREIDAMQSQLELNKSLLLKEIDKAHAFAEDSAVKVLLAQEVRDTQDQLSLVKSDPMYAQVVALMPSSFLKIDDKSKTNLLNAANAAHWPELVKISDDLAHDERQIKGVEKLMAEFKQEIQSDLNILFDLNESLPNYDLEELVKQSELDVQ